MNPHLTRLQGANRDAVRYIHEILDKLQVNAQDIGAVTKALERDLLAGGHRLRQVADAVEAYDAVNVRTMRAYVAAQLAAFAEQTAAGGGSDPTGSGGGTGTHADLSTFFAVAKSDLLAAAVDLTGPCGAFEIVRLATFRLASSYPTLGILDKPTGNNCTGYAVDVVVWQDGELYDVIIDGGGANGIAWNYRGTYDTSRWRAPIAGSIP
jgi:hypothetical protein